MQRPRHGQDQEALHPPVRGYSDAWRGRLFGAIVAQPARTLFVDGQSTVCLFRIYARGQLELAIQKRVDENHQLGHMDWGFSWYATCEEHGRTGPLSYMCCCTRGTLLHRTIRQLTQLILHGKPLFMLLLVFLESSQEPAQCFSYGSKGLMKLHERCGRNCIRCLTKKL